MGERINLPDGGWMQLRDKLTHGGRRQLRAALMAAIPGMRKLPKNQPAGISLDEFPALTLSDGQAFGDFSNLTVVAYVEAWSYPQPVPRTIDEVDDMDPDVADAIIALIAPRAFVDVKGIEVTPDDHNKPGSPTVPSETSDASSEGTTEPSLAG